MRPIKLRIYRKLATSLAAILFFQALFPTAAWALTSGPSQPEVQSFEPVGTSEMVDLFSGDFNYNIPLLEIGGYPINMAYHAGIGMEDEASWVGLGWNLNPGAINRNMRGVPDDFSGQDEEIVKKKVNIRDNFTASLTVRPSIEFFGFDALSVSGGIKYNNYRGVSLTGGFDIGMDIIKMGGFALNMEMGANTEDGVYIKSGLSLDRMIYKRAGLSGGINIGSQYNSRTGLQELSYRRSFNRTFIGTNSIPGGAMSGSLFTFNTPSYVTHAAHNTSNAAYSFDLKPGVAIPFTNTAGAFVGSMNVMKVDGERNMRAFGYLNSHKADHRSHLMDFNREKDGPYYFDSRVLPVTNFTYDTYSIVGQGVGGMYRPYRNQIGYVSDPIAKSNEFGGANGGFEVGVPIFPISWKTSASFGVNFINSYSGLWRDHNTAIGNNGYDFDNLPNGISKAEEALYEKSYFKKIGELSNDHGKYSLLRGDEAISPKTTEDKVDNRFIIPIQNGQTIQDIDYDIKERTVRNQPLSALTMQETKQAGLLKKLENYMPGVNVDLDKGELLKEEMSLSDRRNELNIASSQLYELTVTKPDGMRYIYGLPAYNKSQTSVSFNVEGNRQNKEYRGAVEFAPEDVTDNSRGLDHFSSVEELPGYAYAHLLTSVISADYIDYSGNGPSDDDYGTWVKFNYSKIKPQIGNSDYFWRFPYSEGNVANLNEGFKSYTRDDKGSFVMGEKEIWVLHSIESKNHIAIFETLDRKDGYGATLDGNKVTQFNKNRIVKQQKLDKIVHYAKSELLDKGIDAIPLKTVHFDYSYSLCKGIANHEENSGNSQNGGKLTLDNLYFTYGNSVKGQYSKYKFNYDGPNPDYNRRSQDRWGCYKEEPAISYNSNFPSASGYNPQNIANNDPLSNSDNPYVVQDETLANEYASAWNMTSINLPSGGIIEIEYESDDYAYIQDKRAGQMYTLAGASKSKLLNDLVNSVGNNDLGNSNNQKNFLIVDIEDEIINSANQQNTDDENFRKLFLPENNILYFRSLVDLKDGKHEFVPGYATILKSGVFTTNEGEQGNIYGYIELDGVGLNDDDGDGTINPMVKAAINFARLNLPHMVWPERDPGGSIFGFIQSLITLVTKEPGRFIKGLNNSLLSEGFARSLVLEKSFIRLNNPSYAKKGGGCRVKTINMSDNWSTMTGSKDNNYGHQYFYQKQVVTDDGSKRLVSSGVATYEPQLGNDENPLKQPIVIDVNRTLAPDNDHYIETPIGESLYPSASVGYSEVTVAATRPSDEIKRTATGYSKSKFYTVKDFPYDVNKTSGPAHRNKPNIIKDLLNFGSVDEATANMGYAIILNDMHGKPKETWTYGGMLPMDHGTLQLADDNPKNRISGTKYFYKTDESNDLDNNVKTIDEYGNLTDATVGIESEMVLDYRENRTSSYRVNVSINIDTWVIPWIPFPVITTVTPVPGYSRSKTQFRSAVATKLVNKHGLLDRIEVHRNGSVITTKNEVYDGVTGDVLLTSVNNEFKANEDDNSSLDNLIYNMSYPAHWAYTGMEQSAKNLGAEMYLHLPSSDYNDPSDGKAMICDDKGIEIGNLNESEVFHVGDELLFGVHYNNLVTDEYYNVNRKLWVASVTENEVILIDKDGEYFDFLSVGMIDPFNPFLKVKIVRSGHRNQQSTPIASLTTMNNPILEIFDEDGLSGDNVNTYFSDQANALRVLDFSCQEFDENWQTYCREGEYTAVALECTYTPKIIHPTTGEENKYLTEIVNDDDQCKSFIKATMNIELETDNNLCDSDQGIENYMAEGIDVGDMLCELLLPIETTGNYQGFYIEELLVYSTNQIDPITIPLNDVILNGTDGELFEEEVQESIDLYLKTNYKNAKHNIRFNVSADADNHIMKFESKPWHSPSQEWIGLKRGNSKAKYFNPVTQLNEETNLAYHNSFVGGSFFYQHFDCFSVYVKLRFDDNKIDSDLTDFDYIKLAYDGVAGPNVPFTNTEIFDPNVLECIETEQVPCAPEDEYVNPFLEGIKGNWRPSKSWVHQNVPRVQSDVLNEELLTGQNTPIPESERTGFYKYFDQFWNKPDGDGKWIKDVEHYTLVNEVTKYNPYGEAIESKDALGIYSSAILGYDNKLAIAVGNNTEYRQFAFDGFEEYQFPLNDDQCFTNLHLNLGVTKEDVTEEESHTGLFSLKVDNSISNSFAISCNDGTPLPSEAHQFQINECVHCIPKFDPGLSSFNVPFIVDLWVKGEGQFIINQYDESGNLIPTDPFTPEGPIIEGWQRIYKTFDLNKETKEIKMTFVNLGEPGKPCYIDDFRIYPFDANMKSFVYDPSSLKLMAELDENNHATFYEYDEEWNLIRVKKETEKGVYTLQENQNNIRRSD